MNNSKDNMMALQRIAQAKNEAAGKLYEEALNSEIFPINKLSDDWLRLAMECRRKSVPMAHRVGLIEFKKAVIRGFGRREKLTLFQFGTLSNSIEAVSQDQLGISDEEYDDFLTEAIGHIEWYGKRTKELRDEIQLKVDQEFKMKDAALNGKPNGGLKPIIGEA